MEHLITKGENLVIPRGSGLKMTHYRANGNGVRRHCGWRSSMPLVDRQSYSYMKSCDQIGDAVTSVRTSELILPVVTQEFVKDTALKLIVATYNRSSYVLLN